jgi:hypothetical protein
MGRRIPAKSKPPSRVQEPVLTFDMGQEAPSDSKLMAYMITFPYPKQARSSTGVALVPSSNFSKAELVQKVLDCFANPDSRNPTAFTTTAGVVVSRLGVWREFHKEEQSGQRRAHDHVPTLCFTSYRYAPYKRALLIRHGLASHWSQHCGYWSMVRYVAVASPSKLLNSLDLSPALWDSSGVHPPILDCCYEPLTAKALEAKRRKLVHGACETGLQEPRVTDLDIWALVVRADVRNTADNQKAHLRLVAYAKAHCGEAVVHYLWKRRHQLSSMIDDVWLWENIEAAAGAAERSRADGLKMAAKSQCSCKGEWSAFVVGSFKANDVDIAELCKDVWAALRDGRSETTPVVVLAGLSGGECKSAFLKALSSVYDCDGDIFNLARESGNFPLLDLPHAKVAFLDDYRFNPETLSYASTCLWFDGSDLPIGRPQNVKGMTGNIMYKGTAPIFVTTKLSDLKWLESMAGINASTMAPWDADASMLCRRLKVYKFSHRVPKPSSRFTYCARCFADLLVAHGGAHLN